jgi:hypothetical protein
MAFGVDTEASWIVHGVFSTTDSGAITTGAAGVWVLLVACASTSAVAVTSVTGTTLAWTNRSQTISASDENGLVEVWWAHAASALTNEHIIVNTSGSGNVSFSAIVANCTGIPNPLSPWDTHGGLPGSALNTTGTGSVPSVTGVSTNGPAELLAFYNSGGGYTTEPSEAAGWTLVGDAEESGGLGNRGHMSRQAVSTEGGYTAAPWSNSLTHWITVVDAIAMSPPPVTKTQAVMVG